MLADYVLTIDSLFSDDEWPITEPNLRFLVFHLSDWSAAGLVVAMIAAVQSAWPAYQYVPVCLFFVIESCEQNSVKWSYVRHKSTHTTT